MKRKINPDLTKFILQYAISHGMLDMTDLENSMIKTREEFLKLHNHTITQRKSDGRWVTYLGNKKPYKLIVRVSKEDLENIIIQYYIDSTNSAITFDECFNAWMKSQEETLNPSLTPKSLTNYKAEYKRFIKGHKIEKMEVAEITEKDIRHYFKELINRPEKIARKRLNSVKALISGTFLYAKDELDLETIPIRTVLHEIVFSANQFAEPEEKQKVFYQEHLKVFLKQLYQDNSLISLGIILTSQTGLRVSEIAALSWENVYPDKLYICAAEHSYTKSDGTRVVGIALPKKKKKRDVMLSAEAMDTLSMLYELHPTKSGFIFLNNGERATTRMFDYYIRKTCRACKIPVLSMHKLRSTYASVMLASDCPERLLQDQMGHDEITTTHRYYNVNPFMPSESAAIFRDKSIIIS